MARESRSCGVMPAFVADIGAGRMLGRDLTDDLDTRLAAAWPQFHPNHATEA